MAPDTRSRSRRAIALGAALAAGLGVIALERWGWAGRWRAGEAPPRVWIWAAGDLRDSRPRAFVARRDFDLAAPPARATLTVLGDPEYVLVLNGRRVGSNRYTARAPLDRYEVGSLLVAGRNRIVAELRGPTWAGGFTLRLDDGEGRTIVATGPDWTIHRESARGLFEGARAPAGEPAVVLGRAPFGRWGALEVGPERPRFESVLAVDRVLPALAFRTADQPQLWQPLSRRLERRPSLGPAVEFDFGAEVVGYLQLALRSRAGTVGLVDFAAAPAADRLIRADVVAVPTPGRGLWQDAVPRRFRYVRVHGLEGVTGAGVLPLVESALARLGAPAAPARGLLGIEVPPLRAPVEDVVRRQLEGAPGGGVGQRR